MTVELLEPSDWTIAQARRTVGQLRQAAQPGDEYNGIELFEALCDYLDELYGVEFSDFLHPDDLSLAAAEIERIRSAAPTGSPISTTGRPGLQLADGPGDLDDLDDDVVIRLDQPVNSAVSLADGRELAARLATADDWPGNVGRALIGLYGYLDELYGGDGRFVELLSRTERTKVAAQFTGGVETSATN